MVFFVRSVIHATWFRSCNSIFCAVCLDVFAQRVNYTFTGRHCRAKTVKNIITVEIPVLSYARCSMQFRTMWCDSYLHVHVFCRSVCKQFGTNPGRLTLTFMLLAPGMFIASTAFMPSSFALYMTLLAFGGWFNKEYPIAILAIAAAAILGWPFAAALGSVQKSHNIFLSCLVILQPQ